MNNDMKETIKNTRGISTAKRMEMIGRATEFTACQVKAIVAEENNLMDILAKIISTGGVTLNRRGSMVDLDQGFLVTVHSTNHKTPNKALQAVSDMISYCERMGISHSLIYFGIYEFDSPRGGSFLYSADMNMWFPPHFHQEAKDLGRIMNQESIWDCNNTDIIPTGGTGVTPKVSNEFIAMIIKGING